MNYLFAINIQEELIKDRNAQRMYNKMIEALNPISSFINNYDVVYGVQFVPGKLLNFTRKVSVNFPKKINPLLPFTCTETLKSYGYGDFQLPNLTSVDTVDLMGFSTESDILNVAFKLFNQDVNFQVLLPLVFSLKGKSAHLMGMDVMKSCFPEVIQRNVNIK